MIKNYQKIKIPDENKKAEFFAEVNWDLKDEEVKNCRRIRFTFPDGKTAIVKKEHLHAILFSIGNEEEQRKMIPQKISSNRHYETVISVVAKKDIKAGESITFPLNIPLPTEEEEVIGQMKEDLVKEGRINIKK